MKLISLYIEAFGKIENFSYDFNSGLNTFLEENGFGKTTLCNFIKMMFYGSGKNSKDIDKSDKTKYMPWNGNKYGGNLVFEVNGKRYKVIRNFLKKNDDFKLYDLNTNKESKDYSSNLGEEIFGVNVTSFEESIYIPQKDLIVGFGNDISSKLANVVGDTDDVNLYSSSIKSLEERKKVLKKESSSLLDEINNVEKRIKDLNNNYLIIDSLMENIVVDKERLINLNSDLDNVNLKISEFSVNIEKKNNYDLYVQKINEINLLKDKIDSIEQEFSLLTINDELINSLKEAIKKIENINKRKELVSDDSVIKRCDELEKKFNKDLYFLGATKFIKDKKTLIFSIISIIGFILSIIFFFIKYPIGFLFFSISFVIMLIGRYIRRKNNENLKKIFAEYDLYGDNYQELFNLIQTEYYEYISLLQHKDDIIANISSLDIEYQKVFDDLGSDIVNYVSEYHGLDSLYQSLIIVNEKIKFFKNTLIEKEKESLLFKTNHDLTYEDSLISMSDLQSEVRKINLQINRLTEELSLKKNRIEELKEQVLEIPELKEGLEDLRSRIVEINNQVIIIDYVEEYLSKAQDNFRSKYINPMMERTKYYLDLINQNSNFEFILSSDFEFSVVVNGSYKDVKYLSKGYLQLISYSMRLALIDCFYDKEKPFILLDDPFTDLDDEKLICALKLTKELSLEKQVIYFTCHESRDIL